MRWMRQGGFAFAVLLAGCGSEPKRPPFDNEPVQMKARLEGFSDCGGLEDYIESSAIRQMRSYLEMQKPSYWSQSDGKGGVLEDAGAPVPATADGSQGPKDYTGTNNQVAGVNEADFVQNDGTHIFVLSGNRLYAHRSWPAEQLTLASSTQLEGWPQAMLLEEHGRLVVVSSVYEERPGTVFYAGRSFGGDDAPVGMAYCMGRGFSCGPGFGDTVKVTTLDVTDIAHPKVVDQLYLPGSYSDARRVGASVRLVLSDTFRWPRDMRWSVDYSKDLYDNKSRLEKAIDQLIAKNEQLIRDQALEQWLPKGRHVDGQGQTTPLTYSCSDFSRTNAPSGLGFVTVASMNLDTPLAPPGRTQLIAEPGEVYASKDSLYLATNHWWWWAEPGQKDYVYIHKFDLHQPGAVSYVGTGTVEGHLINQFAMDEHEGVLRVATTLRSRVAEPNHPEWWWGRVETSNRVSTWREGDGQLVEVGRSEDLAPGESIYSARFVGPRGYVVTFRQVDPLYTFDLSDPAHPRKVGELKVPGYSTYLHPLDETHLIALGEYIPENGDWRSRALKLSLFDVSDMAHPVEAFSQLVGTAYGWSEAVYEHKAFNYFPAKKLLAIPFSDYSNAWDYWSGFRSELRVFSVDAATGFTAKGALSMSDVYVMQQSHDWTWYWTPTVRRSVMADDYVYAITDAGMRVAKVDSLQAPLITTSFPRLVVP
ncbi:beta-propeller domain-containing protein [Myxococcaceae bacterium JPH2]|nr:beta-propeller domain-containing protein [Myxococcaceae bacterium JPH2]